MQTGEEKEFAGKQLYENGQTKCNGFGEEAINSLSSRLTDIIKNTGGLNRSIGNFGEQLSKIGELNEKEKIKTVNDFEARLNVLLNAQASDTERLKIILEQTAEIKSIISKYKRTGQTFNQSIYESILEEIILPRKKMLSELASLEANKGKVTVVSPSVLKEQITNDILDTNTGDAENLVEEVEDRPLLTRNGKLMNNAAYIRSLRKFNWSDDRIPDWVTEYMIQQNFVKEGQVAQLKTFLSSGKSSAKILWASKANVLTTIFYELIVNSFLTASKTYIAEKIEKVFVSSSDSLKPLIAKASIMADLKPINITRRVPKDVYHYPDIISFLQTKLLEV